MHYLNGREAKEGDPVIGESHKGSGVVIAGRIHSLNPGATSCNGRIAVPKLGGSDDYYVTVGDCVHAQDAFAAATKPEPKNVEQPVAQNGEQQPTTT